MTVQLKEAWQAAQLDAYKQLQDETEAKRVEREERVLEILNEEKQNDITTTRADGRVQYLGSHNSFVEICMRGDFDRVVEFIKNGDDVNAAHEEFGYSPLHAAAEFGHLNCLRALLNAGVGRVWTGWRRFRIVPEAHVRIESLASDRGYKFRVNARNEMGSSAFSESSAVIVTYQAIDVVDTTSTSIEISWKNLGYCSSPDVDRFEMQIMDCLHKKWITTSDTLTGTSACALKLQPNRLYLLRVRPHSKESGWKDWSDCVATEPVRTLSSSPYPPDVLNIEDIQHDSVLFRWDGGEENGSNI